MEACRRWEPLLWKCLGKTSQVSSHPSSLLTDALSSTDMNTFATHLPPRGVAKQPDKKNPQLRLAGAGSSSCKMVLCSLIKMLN